MASEPIERVGLGVDLLNGEATLSMLRAIRAEMTAIAQLSGKGTTGGSDIYATSNPVAQIEKNNRAIEKAERDHQVNMAKIKAEGQKKYSKDEFEMMAQAEANKRTHRKRLDERTNQILRDEERKRTQEAKQAEENRVKEIQNARRRIAAISQQEGILDMGDHLRYQSKVFRNVGPNSRALNQGSASRRAHAEYLLGYRRAVKERNAEQLKIDIEAERQLREANRQRIRDAAKDPNVLSREEHLRYQSKVFRNVGPNSRALNQGSESRRAHAEELLILREAKRLQKERQDAEDQIIRANEARAAKMMPNRRQFDTLERNRKALGDIMSQQGGWSAFTEAMGGPDKARKTAIGQMYDQIYGQGGAAEAKRALSYQEEREAELDAFVDKAREGRIRRDYQRAQEESARARMDSPGSRLNAADRRLKELYQITGLQPQVDRTRTRRSPVDGRIVRGGSGPAAPDPSQLVPPNQLMNDRGFFTSMDMVGRITRNILLYEAVSRASYGLINYTAQAITAAKTTVEYANALRFATEQQDGNLAANQQLADSLLNIGLSRQQGRAAVVEAARFTQDRPGDTEALTRTVADIAAARGLGIERTDELIEQLRRRESKFYKRIFGKTVESIYDEEARNYLQGQSVSRTSDPGLFIGLEKDEIKSMSDQVASYVKNMDDAAKENAVLNYILSQSSRFQGEAAERALTLAGRLDKLSAAWLNSQENLGIFITDLKVVSRLLDTMTAGANKWSLALAPPELRRTGPRGQISNADIMQFGSDRTTGTRASLINFVDNTLAPSAGAIAATGIAAVLGRHQATLQARTAEYNRVYLETMAKTGGNAAAASNEALTRSREISGGLTRSVGEGLKKITVGMTNSVTRNVNRVTEFLGTGQALGPIDSSYVSPLERSRLSETQQRRLATMRTGANVGFGIAGGALGATLGNLVATKLEAGMIVTAGLTVLGGAAGTAGGTIVGEMAGRGLSDAIAKSGGFGALLGGAAGFGAGASGAALTGGVAGLGLLGGYLFGSLLERPISQTFNLPAYQQRLADREYAQLEANQSAFQRQVSERAAAQREGRLRYRLSGEGMPIDRLTGDEIRRRGIQLRTSQGDDIRSEAGTQISSTNRQILQAIPFLGGLLGAAADMFGGSSAIPGTGRRTLGNFEEVYVTRREARAERLRNRDGVLNALDSYATELGTELYRTSLSPTGSGITNREFDPTALQRELANQAAERTADVAEANRNLTEARAALDRATASGMDTSEFSAAVVRGEGALKNAQDRLEDIKTKQEDITELVRIEAQQRRYGFMAGNERGMQQIDEFNERAAESTRKRQAKEKEERDKTVQQMDTALRKIRDTEQGSFTLIESIATSLTGQDNPYIKVFSEQITLADRMRQQWGFLGDAAVDYFTKVEQTAINRQLKQLDFQLYQRTSELRDRAGMERIQRDDTTQLSRRDQAGLDIASARLTRDLENVTLQNQINRMLSLDGKNAEVLNKRQTLDAQLSRIMISSGFGLSTLKSGPLNQQIMGFSAGQRTSMMIAPDGTVTQLTMDAGKANDYAAFAARQRELTSLSPRARQQLDDQAAESIVSLLGDYSPGQIQAMGYSDLYVGALRQQQSGLGRRVEDAQLKAELMAREDDLLMARMREDERLYGRVSKEADELFLARTEGMSTRDMTYEQFQGRQEALKRTAERAEEERKTAEQNVQKGLEYQQAMLGELAALREALLSGDLGILIQIQNDTQARVDQESLEAVGSGNYNVNLDQRGVQRNPYTDLTRYNRQKPGGIRK